MTLWSSQARGVEAKLPDEIAFPEIEGWTRSAAQHAHPWEARASGADHKLVASYRDTKGRAVDVIFALYAAQEDGREAGAFGEGALPDGTEWRWLASVAAPMDARGDRLQALGTHQRVAYTWFRHGEWTGSSRLQLKLANMQDRLLCDPEPTIMLILSAEDTASQDAQDSTSPPSSNPPLRCPNGWTLWPAWTNPPSCAGSRAFSIAEQSSRSIPRGSSG